MLSIAFSLVFHKFSIIAYHSHVCEQSFGITPWLQKQRDKKFIEDIEVELVLFLPLTCEVDNIILYLSGRTPQRLCFCVQKE